MSAASLSRSPRVCGRRRIRHGIALTMRSLATTLRARRVCLIERGCMNREWLFVDSTSAI